MMMSLLGFAATARALPDIAPQIGDVSIDPGSTVDAGDVVEGCAFHAEAGNEDELMKKVVAHAAEKHGVKVIDEDAWIKLSR